MHKNLFTTAHLARSPHSIYNLCTLCIAIIRFLKARQRRFTQKQREGEDREEMSHEVVEKITICDAYLRSLFVMGMYNIYVYVYGLLLVSELQF